MDPREGRELPSAGELDEETIARKRSRRVSFADITAVHVFDRDEDYETQPDSKPGSTDGGVDQEALGVQGDLSNSDDSKCSARGEEEEDEDEDDGEQERFVRDMDSSSPGSAVGSVTSNDDDNFFGPVSTSFIGSGRLSDAGMSDDNNHDITLDSTAFSLHFRNIAPADDHTANSMGSIRTPSGGVFTADTASLIVPTRSKKPFVGNKLFSGNPSGSADDSSNMSLIEDKSRKYDYGKLSPTLEKLLDEVNRSMQPKSPNSADRVVAFCSHLSEISEVKDSGEHGTHIGKAAGLNAIGNHPIDSQLLESSAKYPANNQIANDNPPNETLLLDTSISKMAQGTVITSEKDNHDVANEATQFGIVVTAQNIDMPSHVHKRSQSNTPLHSDHMLQALYKDKLSGNKYPSVVSPKPTAVIPALVMADGQEQNLESEGGMQTPKSALQSFQAPLQGSVSSLRAKRQQLFLDPAVTSQSKSMNNSVQEQPPSSLELELTRHAERISAIKNRMSKFRILETPDLDNFRLGKSQKAHVPLDLEGMYKRELDINMGVPVINMEENLLNSVQVSGAKTHNVEPKHLRFMGPDNARESTRHEADQVFGDALTLSDSVSCFQLSRSEINMLQSPLTFNNLTKRASNPDAHDLSQREKITELKESSQPLNTSSVVDNVDHCILKESFPVEDDLVGKKRRIKQYPVMDERHISKLSRMEKSPIFSNEPVANRPVIHPNHHSEIMSKSRDMGGQSTAMHLSDVLSKVSEATKSVFSPTIHKLSLQELDMLENMLCELQMARKYLKISTSLRNNDHLLDLPQQRVTEARLLQDKFLHEQAKIQIKRAKLDQLHNKAQLTQLGLQECHDLKSMFSQLCLQITRGVQNKENHLHPVSSISGCPNQEERERLASVREELKVLEEKVDLLLKSLEVCFKIKGNLNVNGIIKVAREHLEMRNRISTIHQHLRLWELSNIVKRDNRHDIVLNYCNLLIQRFTIKSGQVSGILVSNSLNEESIGKSFQNMNAFVAFEFVFGEKSESRITSSKCFQQKTLETSLLLGTLLDVVEEVQVAGMEIMNLTFSKFYRLPSDLLELHLCFMNFKSGQKVTLSIDLSQLKCAVYPLEPSELKYKICETETTLSPSLSDRIMAALRSLQGERLVILRLCRSMSQLVQDSTS